MEEIKQEPEYIPPPPAAAVSSGLGGQRGRCAGVHNDYSGDHLSDSGAV